MLIGGHRNDSAAVYKIGPDGSVRWVVVFDRPAASKQRVYSVAVTSDNFIIGTGYNNTASAAPEDNGFWFKLDLGGNLIWANRESEGRAVRLSRIHESPTAGRYILTGHSVYLSGTWADPQMFEVDALTGAVVSVSDRFNLSSPSFIDNLHASVLLPGKGLYVTGHTFRSGSSTEGVRFYLAKFDLSFNPVWGKYYAFSPIDVARLYGIDLIQRGNRLCIGYFGDYSGSSTNYTCGMQVCDENGNPLWCKSYPVGGSTMERECAVAAHPSGYSLAGTYMSSPIHTGLFLLNTDTLGNLQWKRSFAYPGANLTFELWGKEMTYANGSHWIAANLLEGTNQDIVLIRTDSLGNIDCLPPGILVAAEADLPKLQMLLSFTAIPTPFSGVNIPGRCVSLPDDECRLPDLLGNDTIVCGDLLLDASVSGAGPYTYTWQDGSNLSTFNAVSSGTFWVTVSWDCCSFSDTINVVIDPGRIISLGPDTLLCAGSSLLLTPEIPPAATVTGYLWSTGDTTGSIVVSAGGNYSITVYLSDGCEATDTRLVTYLTDTVLDLGPDRLLCYSGSSEVSVNMPGFRFLWSTGDTTSAIIITQSGTYTLQANNQCQSLVDSVNVLLPDSASMPFVPNVFTPNGDGFNDRFAPVFDFSGVDDFEINIFDRWGVLIHQITDKQNYWDGTTRGIDAPAGVYVWTMNFIDCDGAPAESSGIISLLR